MCKSQTLVLVVYMIAENPDWVKEQGKKSIDLDDRLKQVYVTSTDPQVEQCLLSKRIAKHIAMMCTLNYNSQFLKPTV